MCLLTQLSLTLSRRLWSHVLRSMTNSKSRKDLHLRQFRPPPMPLIRRRLKSLLVLSGSRAIRFLLLTTLPMQMPRIESTEWVNHGTQSSTPGRQPQRRKPCKDGLLTAPLVRRKSRKDRPRASPLSKTVRKPRMTMKMMATRMMNSLLVLQTIMLSLESLAKLNNPVVQLELVVRRLP